jgi:hypothetical protein
MTKSTSHSDESPNAPVMYESAVWLGSRLWPGVQFRLLRMSLIRRHRLMQELKSLASEQAFHRAAPQEAGGEISAAELQTRIDEMVIRTALLEIKGLSIDGKPATVESLIDSGPENLSREIAEAIAEESFLNEDERKN